VGFGGHEKSAMGKQDAFGIGVAGGSGHGGAQGLKPLFFCTAIRHD
jgi:hypothetical protein